MRRLLTAIAVTIGITAPLGMAAMASSEEMVALSGHSSMEIPDVAPVGEVAASTNIPLAILLPCPNPEGLEEAVQQIYDPSSPQFHHYLTPRSFAAQFAPSEADYSAVESFAIANGLTITQEHSNRLVLDVAGPASAVEHAFNVHLSNYTLNGRTVRLPDVPPTVPASIAGIISSVTGIDNANVRTPAVRMSPSIKPQGATPYGFTPTNINDAYNITGSGLNGSGQTLAVFELDGYTASDVVAYENQFGLPQVTLHNVIVDGASYSPTNGDMGAAEVTLDIELQQAIAPEAHEIEVYEGPNTDTGVVDTYEKIAEDDTATSISSSWAGVEVEQGSSYLNSENTIFAQMATQGQTIYAASGDNGAYDNSSWLLVNDPASQPHVCGVGGTTLTMSGNGYGHESTWIDGGGGVSGYWTRPSYQGGFGYSSTYRNVPDVSLDADPNTPYAIYVWGGWYGFGGTSCAAPLWAGFTALVNQQRIAHGLGTMGEPMPVLYQIGAAQNYDNDFHDIDDNSNNGYYHAIQGYDDATGLGTIDGLNLLADMAGATLTSPPATPTNVTAVANGSTSISVTWTAVSGASSYGVYRSLKSGGPYTLVSSPTNASYTDSSINLATWYYYVVKAVAGPYSSSNSTQASAQTTPGAPSGLRATVSGSSEVGLSWFATDGATSYEVKRGSSSGGPYTQIATTTSTTYADYNVSGGTSYYYVVAAVDAGGAGPTSNEAGTATAAVAPAGLTATTISGTEIDLNWTAASGATSYSVQRSTRSGGPYTKIATVADATTFDNTSLAASTTYYYVVASVNAGGTGPNTTQATATTAPPSPSGLHAKTNGSTEIDLTWSAANGATNYIVEDSEVEGGPYTQIGTSSTASYKSTGLTSATQYYYVVEASNAGSSSAISNEGTAMTTPSTPTGLSASTAGSTSVSLTWTASTGATSYYVLKSLTATGTYSRVGSASSNSDTVAGLTPSTTYYFEVEANDAGGSSVNSADASATTLSPTPAGLKAKAASSTQIQLTWTAATGVSSYAVFRGSVSGGPYNQIGTSNTAGYLDNGLTSSTEYYYVIQSIDAGGSSPNSSEASATTLPSVPTNVTATANSSSDITVAWSSVGGATSYVVMKSSTAAGPYSKVGSVSTNSDDVTGLAAGTTYYFEVAAVNAGGTGSSSANASATTLSSTPSGLRAKTLTSSSIMLTWTAAKGATQYAVLCGTSEGGPYNQVGTTSALTYTSTGLSSATQYYYVIEASDTGGTSPYSNEATAMTLAGVPSNLAASAQSSSAIGLTWTAVTGATSYVVYRASVAGGPYSKVASPSTNSDTATGMSAGTTYYFEVAAVDAGGTGSPSGDVAGTTLPATPSGARAASEGSTEIMVSWSAATGAMSYEVLRSSVEGGPYSPLGTSSKASYTDTGLSANTEYYYVVEAVGSGGSSPNSNEATATTTPASPSGLTASAASNTQIDLSWTASTGATSYAIWRSTSANSGFVKIGTTNNTTFNNTGLTATTMYYYAVTATGSGGTSAESSTTGAETE